MRVRVRLRCLSDLGNIGTFDVFVQNVASSLKELGATHFDFLVNNAGNSHREYGVREGHGRGGRQPLQGSLQGSVLPQPKLVALINDGGRIVNVSTGRTRIISPEGRLTALSKGPWKF